MRASTTDDNAAFADSDKSNVKIYFLTVPYEQAADFFAFCFKTPCFIILPYKTLPASRSRFPALSHLIHHIHGKLFLKSGLPWMKSGKHGCQADDHYQEDQRKAWMDHAGHHHGTDQHDRSPDADTD